MNLDAAYRTVLGSDADDWYATESLHHDDDVSHNHEATFRDDVALQLHWGLVLVRGFSEPWSEKFADHWARSFYVDVRYGGSLIHRGAAVSADGGRYVLPLPKLMGKESGEIEFHVTMEQEAVARLLHDLTHANQGDETFDRGMEIAGLKAVP
jgi:hypothetical protein